MSSIDQSYFRNRTDEERRAADQASDGRAADAHRELADEYDKRANADDPDSTAI